MLLETWATINPNCDGIWILPFDPDVWFCYWPGPTFDVSWGFVAPNWNVGRPPGSPCPFSWPPSYNAADCWTPLVAVPFSNGFLSLTPLA